MKDVKDETPKEICPIMSMQAAAIAGAFPDEHKLNFCVGPQCAWWTCAYTTEGYTEEGCSVKIGAMTNLEGRIPV